MKPKLKYILGSIVMGLIVIFSFQHSEKYHIAIPVIFTVLFFTSLYLLFNDTLEL